MSREGHPWASAWSPEPGLVHQHLHPEPVRTVRRQQHRELLAAGVRIHRFTGAMVHAKTATVDGAWSTVGTANIDRLSMTGNYEVNVEFIDPAMAEEMERIFATDLRGCEELTLEKWERRGVHKKLTELFLAPLRPLL